MQHCPYSKAIEATQLPIVENLIQVDHTLQHNNTVILSAPPGAGKSTLLPLALLGASWLNEKKILMLEPRRLAARTIATRMADLIDENVGATVGYRVRFENKISPTTRIEVLTEGILTRMLQRDNALEGVGMVIFDEFHERSLFAEVALALCRESQQVLRPDLRIVVMSATLDLHQLSKLLDAPIIESKGRHFPVEVIYSDHSCDESMISEMTARVIQQALKDQKGDILAFLPGEKEIRNCEEILKNSRSGFMIHPLYGSLPTPKQTAAILPDHLGRRKVVLATSIAETSLTIEGVNIVVDCGYGRTAAFNPNTGLTRLETMRISKDRCDQRAGRAGRLGPGVCYRLWTRATHDRLADHRTPEIMEADLASLVLDMVNWGVNDIDAMTWLTPPPKGNLSQAFELLMELEAIQDHKITEYGRKMQQLPCHPRIAHMLICAEASGAVPLATDLAAILEERDPMGREAGIDINLRIEALRRYRQQSHHTKGYARIEKIAASYRQLFSVQEDNRPVDPYETGILIVQAYPERIASAIPGNNAQFQLSNGQYVMASHRDDLAHDQWLAVAHLDAREGVGKIFLASSLNPADLRSMVKTREVIAWESRKGGLIAVQEMRIGNIILQSKPLQISDRSKVDEVICQAISKEGEQLLDFSEEFEQWQNRLASLRIWHPEQNWPDVTMEALLANCRKWLPPYLGRVTRNEDLKRINLFEIMQNHLDYDKQKKLQELAPEKMAIPNGSKIKLRYFKNGSQPIMAVRLQEMFGQKATPRVDAGKMPVLLHLLSPGFKPVQVTSDLESFWKSTYFEVKKELRSRYPKHKWPDDPYTLT